MIALLLTLLALVFIIVLTIGFKGVCAATQGKMRMVYSALQSSNHFVISQDILALFGISIIFLYHTFKIPEPYPVIQ